VNQMATCIKANLEVPEPAPAPAAPAAAMGPLPDSSPGAAPVVGQASGAGPAPPAPAIAPARPVNALGLLWTILVGRLRALFGRSR
jgi:hypothetical protein